MAIIDKRTELADAISVAAAAGTINVGSQVDASVVRDLGAGQTVWLIVTVDTAVVTGGAAGTIRFQLASDSTASIATDGTQSIHATSALFVTDDAGYDLEIGDIAWQIALPTDGQEPYEQFIGLQAVIATTTTTAGKVNAWLSLAQIGEKRTYADASN